ncbi:MAG: Spy/CpxP family protein refolding chaperone [Bacteroidales bacterium]|nr:Spy/CpxP family protein refolding chaperone [Bacteroidales bacterium]
MKKSFILIAMLLVAFTAAAQEKKDQDPKERFFQARVKEMVYRLNITDEQKPEFVKVYRAYSAAMHEAVGQKPKREGVQKGENQQKEGNQAKPERRKITMEEAVKLEKGKVERQQKAQAVKLQYIDEFAKVLKPEQLVRFFGVEQQIQQKLNSRQQGRKPGVNGQRARGNRPQRPQGNRMQGNRQLGTDNGPAETD